MFDRGAGKLLHKMIRLSKLNLLAQRRCRQSVRFTSYGINDVFSPSDAFVHRHIGASDKDRVEMLKRVGFDSLDDLVTSTLPAVIRNPNTPELDAPMSESEALAHLKTIMSKNKVLKSFIGMGYFETLTPAVLVRNVLENPGWYTAYTPYQGEISQGRLEGLLNFQTMVSDLTGMEICNASLLDEATAAAEAMNMCYAVGKYKKKKFFVDQNCHPQNIALMRTRGSALGLTVEVGDILSANFSSGEYCGAVVQYPDTYGGVHDWSQLVDVAHHNEVLMVACTDLMASVLIKPAGELGFDIAVGSAQRFGVPMGFGGPHAGFLSTSETYSRKMPGRIIGVSKDSAGRPALRMAMQTREQHIRRDKATSNICTAQALLANMASCYGVYHGPSGLKAIARRIHGMTIAFANTLAVHGFDIDPAPYFDTLIVDVTTSRHGSHLTPESVRAECEANGCNIRILDSKRVGICFGEAITKEDTVSLLRGFNISRSSLQTTAVSVIPDSLKRKSAFMEHPVFNSHNSETKMLRYLKMLENMDLSLTRSMIALGSCTMKLNATVEMMPITWNETANIHPFAPLHQTVGYREMIHSLHADLAKVTGFAAMSSQPNSGAQGEYAGLMAITSYHKSRGEDQRNVCIIPTSAHGTNPASAVLAGMEVVICKSDARGNVDLNSLREKVEKYRDRLSCFMITYPSTYGVFEEEIKNMIDLIHSNGGQVYMDGANMNAQCMLTSPGFIGADVCHLNLHKTFCIPHGGGGPGVGTIGVAKHLAPFLPGHVVHPVGGEGYNVAPKRSGAVSGAPYGSASILPITYMYLKMLGSEGLKQCTMMAILNANYMAKRLEEEGDYLILFKGKNGQVAHEFIVDLREFKTHGIVEEDVAKRLQDYGFHGPTMSWPVTGTLMVEPTESEDKAEMDRFCDAMILIRREIDDVVSGRVNLKESPLKLSPHTMSAVVDPDWDSKYKYSRMTAAFPAPWVTEKNKFWPPVGRIDNVFGDRNLMCSCPPVTSYEPSVHSSEL